MLKSETCEHVMVDEVLPCFQTRELGIPVVLHAAVKQRTCNVCGEVSHEIPYPERLWAAAAVLRAKQPAKLTGKEIVFLRKALGKSAKDLAEFLSVAAETLSRWENDKAPMSLPHEKLLRIFVLIGLGPKALAIQADPSEVLEMDIQAVRSADSELVMEFSLVYVKEIPKAPAVEAYQDQVLKAA